MSVKELQQNQRGNTIEKTLRAHRYIASKEAGPVQTPGQCLRSLDGRLSTWKNTRCPAQAPEYYPQALDERVPTSRSMTFQERLLSGHRRGLAAIAEVSVRGVGSPRKCQTIPLWIHCRSTQYRRPLLARIGTGHRHMRLMRPLLPQRQAPQKSHAVFPGLHHPCLKAEEEVRKHLQVQALLIYWKVVMLVRALHPRTPQTTCLSTVPSVQA